MFSEITAFCWISVCLLAGDTPFDRLSKVVSAGLLHCRIFVISILRGGTFETKYLFLSHFSVYSFIYINIGYQFPILFRRLSSFIIFVYFDAHVVPGLASGNLPHKPNSCVFPLNPHCWFSAPCSVLQGTLALPVLSCLRPGIGLLF